jgi:CRISPR-associated protein Csx16
MRLIITRHHGAVEWLRRKGIEGTLIEHASGDEGREGDSVYGPLPLDYVEKFLKRNMVVYFIALPGLTLDKRTGDLSADEMEAAGACLLKVRSLTMEPL